MQRVVKRGLLAGIAILGLSAGPCLADPPAVLIVGPADGVAYIKGDVAVLEGRAVDGIDGSLVGGSLRWYSDVDGILGEGRRVEAELSGGAHLITLGATNSRGEQSFAEVHVTVE